MTGFCEGASSKEETKKYKNNNTKTIKKYKNNNKTTTIPTRSVAEFNKIELYCR